jgi:hypothetical protein
MIKIDQVSAKLPCKMSSTENSVAETSKLWEGSLIWDSEDFVVVQDKC